ncbi:unnamed protein product [Euphydryas editha]|uniref:Uncharacterized protein n=1 Tax=Euphydryas editha TaxID=104508 RepID=A0AAU9UFH0_EUPED|nr:unnamed protein product [Euphydryas editha]
MNMDKTKIMSNAHVVPTPISVGNSTLEVVDEYIYLGQKVQLRDRGQSLNPVRMGSVREVKKRLFIRHTSMLEVESLRPMCVTSDDIRV